MLFEKGGVFRIYINPCQMRVSNNILHSARVLSIMPIPVGCSFNCIPYLVHILCLAHVSLPLMLISTYNMPDGASNSLLHTWSLSILQLGILVICPLTTSGSSMSLQCINNMPNTLTLVIWWVRRQYGWILHKLVAVFLWAAGEEKYITWV